MKKISRIHASRAFAALLALAASAGIAEANTATLTVTPANPTLTCDTGTGASSTPVTIVVTATGGITSTTAAIVVGLGTLPAGVTVVPVIPTITTLAKTASSTAAVSLSYNVNVNAAGCAGYTTGSIAFNFTAKAGTITAAGTTTTQDATVTPVVNVTNTTSGLSVPASVTLTCTATTVSSNTTYAAGANVVLPVSSTSNLGTPFTVDLSNNALPAWLSVTPTSGGTATAGSPIALTLSVAACGSSSSSATYALKLANAPVVSDKNITVNFTVKTVTLSVSPLTSSANPASFTYVKGSGSNQHADVTFTSTNSPAPFFTVDLSTLPSWLTVDSTGANTPGTIRFSNTSVCDSLAPGTYTASVGLNVSGSAPFVQTVKLLITNSAPKLTISGGTTQALNWTIGTPVPTAIVTAVSTDSPIPFTVTTAGALQPSVTAAQLTGLAYSFGTPIVVNFSPLLFASAQPGSQLSGTVSLTWGNPSVTTVVTLNYAVLPPGAAAVSLNPSTLPTNATSNYVYYISLVGTGFVQSSDPTQQTRVGFAAGSGTGAALTFDSYMSVYQVVDANHITLKIVVPPGSVSDANLKFSPTGTGNSTFIGVCNPNGSTCSQTSSPSVAFSIGNGPIIQAVSSASTFAQVTAPPQSIAPYDMLSIFGNNFCSAGGTGCSSSTILTGAPSALTLTYPTSLSKANDSTGLDSNTSALSVAFWAHTGTVPNAAPITTPVAVAPILFATNNQINILAPSTLNPGTHYDMFVLFGTLSSAGYEVSVVATDPGIYTVGSDGQGDAAAFARSMLVNSTNPAGVRTSGSDTVTIYVTGLGRPDSTGDPTATQTTALTFPNNCLSPAAFLGDVQTSSGVSLTTLDGSVIQSALLGMYVNTTDSTTHPWYPPCAATANLPTVKIGGVTATVTYAGWVPDSVAGLYQINATLPVNTSASQFANAASIASGVPLPSPLVNPVQLPVVVQSNTVNSQPGVTMWVGPKLLVAPPTSLTGTVNVSYADSVSATGGTGAISYALVSGVLPAGLTLTRTGGSAGQITGTPAANTGGATYTVTIKATDSAPYPISDTVTFTLTIAGGLYVTSTSGSGYISIYGNTATIATVTATGGSYPYTYAVTAPGTIPAGVSLGQNSGVLGVSQNSAVTPAGLYNFTVRASDSSTPAVTGSTSFMINIPLLMTVGSVGSPALSGSSAVVTVTPTGQTSTVACTSAISAKPAGATGNFSVDASGNVVLGSVNTAGSYTFSVTCTDSGTAPGATGHASGTSAPITVTVGS